jgi:hypothetical protein
MRLPDELLEAAGHALFDLHGEMRAKNGIERMALTQMIMAQGRTAWLTDLATKQNQPQALASVLEACEKASSTYMRLMRAFQEYRQPKLPSATVSIGVQQANLAAQQLVQNFPKENVHKNVDEQTKIPTRGETIDAAVVSPVGARVALAQGRNPEESAMDQKHRTENSAGKSQGRYEFARPRRKVRHRG